MDLPINRPMEIASISAHQVYDSRGNPTLEATVKLRNGVEGTAIVPSGASVGKYEALELRDGAPEKFLGRSVMKAIQHVNEEIHNALCGRNVCDQESLDQALIDLDGTKNKSRLGANAILGTSMALARAAANTSDVPLHVYLGEGAGDILPLPEIQIFGGGAHSAGRIDVQDFMIICVGAQSYGECLEMTFNVYHRAGELMKRQGRLAGVADEGGYWPVFDSNEQAFEFMIEAIEMAGYRPGQDIAISLDIAASELFQKGTYHLGLESRSFSPEEFAELLVAWCERYPIVSVEDPFAEDDFPAWAAFTKKMGGKIQIIGDDLFTTNLERIHYGTQKQLANAVLIKLNQIGTVTETLQCIRATQKAQWNPVVSARSGETEDTFIAHLAVATNAGQLKVGSFARSERMVKWNELLRIERRLGSKARFVGADILKKGRSELKY
jgi:enolase